MVLSSYSPQAMSLTHSLNPTRKSRLFLVTRRFKPLSFSCLHMLFINVLCNLCCDMGDGIHTGEWWNADPEAVISQALQTGGGPNVSDAYTINGLPGPLYNCSSKSKGAQLFQWYFYGIFMIETPPNNIFKKKKKRKNEDSMTRFIVYIELTKTL